MWPLYLQVRTSLHWEAKPLVTVGPSTKPRAASGGQKANSSTRQWLHVRASTELCAIGINSTLLTRLLRDGVLLTSSSGVGSASNTGTALAEVLESVSEDDLSAAKAYLVGLLWCLNCYRIGRCPDYTFHLSADARPNAEHLLALAARHKDSFHASTDELWATEELGTFPMRPHEMLLLLLPLSSRRLLPRALRHLAAPGHQSPVGMLYAMEVDDRLAELQNRCRDLNREAQSVREHLLAALRLPSSAPKPKVKLPDELRSRLAQANEDLVSGEFAIAVLLVACVSHDAYSTAAGSVQVLHTSASVFRINSSKDPLGLSTWFLRRLSRSVL